jgi:hypothetical protein
VSDPGLCSYVLIGLLVQGGVHAVFRVHQKQIVNFTAARAHVSPAQGGRKRQQGKPRSHRLARLRECDQLVEWLKPTDCPDWMDDAQFARLPDGLKVRELQYRVQRKGFRVHTITLVTTLVDAQRYSVEALSQLYFTRWGIETNYAHLKTTMGLDVLKCKTVDGVFKELIVFAFILQSGAPGDGAGGAASTPRHRPDQLYRCRSMACRGTRRRAPANPGRQSPSPLSLRTAGPQTAAQAISTDEKHATRASQVIGS